MLEIIACATSFRYNGAIVPRTIITEQECEVIVALRMLVIFKKIHLQNRIFNLIIMDERMFVKFADEMAASSASHSLTHPSSVPLP